MSFRPITITWLKDKLPFSPREDPRYELLESIVAEGIKSEIVIRNADRRDSALFSCVTSNAYGHDDTNIQLIMQGIVDSGPNYYEALRILIKNYLLFALFVAQNHF